MLSPKEKLLNNSLCFFTIPLSVLVGDDDSGLVDVFDTDCGLPLTGNSGVVDTPVLGVPDEESVGFVSPETLGISGLIGTILSLASSSTLPPKSFTIKFLIPLKIFDIVSVIGAKNSLTD